MPLGLVRLNERRKRPNENISFIKTLDTPDSEISMDILERVAAIVWPIMKDNGLGVMSLEEFPPNREFWGRNFNAGECIQLVLKSPTTGRWLPFSFVCRVMIHELAHIKQMNHSRAFHAVRIGYTKELDALIARGYSGEGFWSRGQSLSAELTAPRELAQEELPKELCGGSYRKAKKTGNKRKLTYAEQKQKRKERLFGTGEGEHLGADEELRQGLEKGKGKAKKAVMTKPRVAQSQRGRDLRLEAALKRAEQIQSNASTSAKKEEEEDSGVDDEDAEVDYEEEYEAKAVDMGDGRQGVKNEEPGEDDDYSGNELDDMKLACATTSGSRFTSASQQAGRFSDGPKAASKHKEHDSDTEDSDIEIVAGPSTSSSKPTDGRTRSPTKASVSTATPTPPPPSQDESESSPDEEEAEDAAPAWRLPRLPSTPPLLPTRSESPPAMDDLPDRADSARNVPVVPQRSPSPVPEPVEEPQLEPGQIACKVCTSISDSQDILCCVCGNVLDTNRTASWQCKAECCRGSAYRNPLDAGVCSICGTRKA